MRAGEREVSADAISRAKDYQVATHQLACVDDPELAVSAYAGAHREQRLPPRSGHPLLLPSVLTVALPSGLAAWLAWRHSTWAPVAVIDIAAPAEEIFDVIVDARNEPRWNPKMLRAQMLTPGPVAAGTTFRVVFGRGVGEALIEDTKIDRPRSWTATSRSRALDAQTEGQIHDISGRCEVFLHTQLRPPRVLAPAHSGVGLVDAPDLGSRPAQGEGPCRA